MMTLADLSFYKFLAEMSGTKREMFHFTNTAGLAGILKDGYIKAGEYDVNLSTEREVSQGRTSEDRKGNPELPLSISSMETEYFFRESLQGSLGNESAVRAGYLV